MIARLRILNWITVLIRYDTREIQNSSKQVRVNLAEMKIKTYVGRTLALNLCGKMNVPVEGKEVKNLNYLANLPPLETGSRARTWKLLS